MKQNCKYGYNNLDSKVTLFVVILMLKQR